MPETANIIFSYKELVTLMLKQQGIHEGVWALFIRFGLNATNVGGSSDDLRPTALVPVMEIGIQKAEQENNVSVDAAKVNPRQSESKPTISPRAVSKRAPA